MRIPLTLLLCQTTLCIATGDEEVETHHLRAAVGSSVSFPGVKIDQYTMYELSRVNGGDVVVTCPDGCKVRDPYTRRGQFFHDNGTFLLSLLRVEDSGTFESKINLTMKGIIDLQVWAPLTEAVLLKQEERGNNSQCLIVFTCLANGDGPFNFTFLRNDEIFHNVVTTHNSSSVTVDGWDPATSGGFYCNVANLVSSKTSTTTYLLTPAYPGQIIMVLTIIDFLILWTIAILCSLSAMACNRFRKWLQRQRNGNDNDMEQTSRKPSLCSQAFTLADNLLGFLKEFIAAIISIYGGLIPKWCCSFPIIFFLCRMLYWLTTLVNVFVKKRASYSSTIKGVCGMFMSFSSVVGVPVFCVAILVIFSKYYYCPCGILYSHYLPIVPVALTVFFVVSCASILIGKKKKDNDEEMGNSQPVKGQNEFSGLSPNGNVGQPEDNRNPNCDGPVSDIAVDIPNNEEESPEQEARNEHLTAEGPEDHVIPKPEEGRPQVAKNIPCKSHVRESSNYENSEDTRNPEGQCLLTPEMDEVVLDKDRVANG